MIENNQNFNIICEIDENKTYISCNEKIDAEIFLYEWFPDTNISELLYMTTSIFNNNSFYLKVI